MKLFKKETAYLSQILVRISSVAGLLDMMRYDRCFPATEDDANKIVKLLPLATPAGKLQPGDRVVRLLRCARNDGPPTVARWRSFNCSVIDFRSISEPTYPDFKRFFNNPAPEKETHPMSDPNNTIPFTLTNESISVVWDGKPYTVQKGQAQFHGLRDVLIAAMQSGDFSKVGDHLTVASSMQQWLGDKFVVGENTISTRTGQRREILFQGSQLPANLIDRIWTLANAGESPESLFNFWERLKKNPSKRSVDSLYEFLRHENIPIEKDGTFLAYKGINRNMTDCHTGTIDNSPGTVHEMERNLVSDDPRTACHYGFHVGAAQYALGFGPVAVICRVDPEHVVCVPYDSSQHKMRVCKYEVVGNYSGQKMPSTTMVDDTKVTDKAWEDDGGDVEGEGADDANIVDTNPSSFIEGDLLKKIERVKATLKPETAAYFNRMQAGKLMEQSIDHLRKYASQTLKIVGASKLVGGKAKLVAAILKARKARRKGR